MGNTEGDGSKTKNPPQTQQDQTKSIEKEPEERAPGPDQIQESAEQNTEANNDWNTQIESAEVNNPCLPILEPSTTGVQYTNIHGYGQYMDASWAGYPAYNPQGYPNGVFVPQLAYQNIPHQHPLTNTAQQFYAPTMTPSPKHNGTKPKTQKELPKKKSDTSVKKNVSSREECWFYKKGGFCREGSICKYSHTMTEPMTQQTLRLSLDYILGQQKVLLENITILDGKLNKIIKKQDRFEDSLSDLEERLRGLGVSKSDIRNRRTYDREDRKKQTRSSSESRGKHVRINDRLNHITKK